MSAARQLEAPSPRCEICSVPVAIASTGRPRRYCSDRCKQKAARNRRILVSVETLLREFTAHPIDWSDEDHRVT